MKKLTALLLATSLSMTLFGCNNKDKGTQKKGKDTMVSVWLVTSETSYEADGSKGRAQRKYTYTDKGLPLTYSQDIGPKEEVWDDSLGIYVDNFLSYDGNIDTYYEYFYNKQGDYLYYTSVNKIFDVDGTETVNNNSNLSGAYAYHYDSSGRIDTVDFFGAYPGGGYSDEVVTVMHHCYDDNGNLIEIYNESLVNDGMITWAYDFRYNAKGQLIASASQLREAMFYYTYEYNSKGLLSNVACYRKGPFQTPLDDQHVVQSSYSHEPFDEPSREKFAAFTYDSQGRLVSRENDEGVTSCTYDSNGNLKTVTYPDGVKYIYVDNERDATGSAKYLVRDSHGNVIKFIDEDGAYVEFTYQEFRLSKEEAKRCQNAQLLNSRRDPTGGAYYYNIGFYPGCGAFVDLPLPSNNVLFFTDSHRY